MKRLWQGIRARRRILQSKQNRMLQLFWCCLWRTGHNISVSLCPLQQMRYMHWSFADLWDKINPSVKKKNGQNVSCLVEADSVFIIFLLSQFHLGSFELTTARGTGSDPAPSLSSEAIFGSNGRSETATRRWKTFSPRYSFTAKLLSHLFKHVGKAFTVDV